MAHYRNQFTANGHSIRFLKDRALSLKSERHCAHHEALNEVAREVGYTDWAAIMAELPEPSRDEFFAESLQRNDRTRPDYREFLSRRAAWAQFSTASCESLTISDSSGIRAQRASR